jgi:hypothetical protein
MRSASSLAGLLAIIVLPAAAGLGGVALGDPSFAAGYGRGLTAAAGFAAAGLVVAMWMFRGRRRGPEYGPQLDSRPGSRLDAPFSAPFDGVQHGRLEHGVDDLEQGPVEQVESERQVVVHPRN